MPEEAVDRAQCIEVPVLEQSLKVEMVVEQVLAKGLFNESALNF